MKSMGIATEFLSKSTAASSVYKIYLLLACFIIPGLISCDTTSTSQFEPITISGIVTDTDDQPLANAIVRIIQPIPERFTTTDEEGNYFFTVEVDSSITFRIEAQKEGYQAQTVQFLAIPERDANIPNLKLSLIGMEEEDTDDDPDTDDPGPDPDESGEAAYLTFSSVSNENIHIRESGNIESSVIEFVVTDSSGVPVGNHHAVDVHFEIVSGPDGGENIYPATVRTDDGKARATLASGTIAGGVQIKATFSNSNGVEIRSQPVRVVIHAGLPSQNHFTILTETRNVAWTAGGESVNIVVLVGDKYGNEVQDGTAVYFTSDGGFIHGSAYTSNGRASSTLTVGNPVPPDGIVTVRASTFDDNQQEVSASTQLIFSGSPLITVTPESFNIPNAEDQTFNYTVQDANGNPMAPGTNITVTVEGDEISVLGDVSITVGEPNVGLTNLDQLTDYTFIIDDAEPDVDNDTPAQITIEVDGPNGNARKTITGRKAKTRF